MSCVTALNQTVATVTEENSQLSDLLVAADKQTTQHQELINVLARQVQELQEQVQTASSDQVNQEELAAALELQKVQFTGDLEELNQKVLQSGVEYTQLKTEKDTVDQLLLQLEGDNSVLKSELEGFEEYKSDIQSVLYEQTTELKAAQSKIEELSQQGAQFDTLQKTVQESD